MHYKNYTDFLVALIALICADGYITPSEIALTHDEVMQHYLNGGTPESLYNDIWQQDAGNYYKI